MAKYIDRLMACGYSEEKAREICQEFSKNLNLFDLEMFIETLEEVSGRVGKI